MPLVKKEDWKPIAEAHAEPNDMVLIYAPDGNYAFVAGMHLESTVKEHEAKVATEGGNSITHFVKFAVPPESVAVSA